MEAVIDSISSLLEALKSTFGPSETIWYRGHADKAWELIPSLARQERGLQAEQTLIKRFKQSAASFTVDRPETEWDWLFLMQHYGAPTRLLDWSESPLVGLYFAVAAEEHSEADACLWCLEPIKLNELANISPTYESDIPCFDIDDVLELYLPDAVIREQTSRLKPAAGIALRRFARLTAQLGVFTITHRDQHAIESVGSGEHIHKLVIPKERKASILAELEHLRVSKLTLFPELESVAGIAKEFIR